VRRGEGRGMLLWLLLVSCTGFRYRIDTQMQMMQRKIKHTPHSSCTGVRLLPTRRKGDNIQGATSTRLRKHCLVPPLSEGSSAWLWRRCGCYYQTTAA
jgi:hypothetical protein